MADFAQALNKDLNQVKTAARYDSDAVIWLNDVANFAKNAGGLWVPVSPTDPMPVRTSDLEALIGALAAVAVTDPTQAASVIAALKGLLTDIGQNADEAVAAGAVGSISAKIRRLTTDLAALLALDFATETKLEAVRALLAGTLTTQLTGRITIETALNAVSVAAGGVTAAITLTTQGESEVWLLVNIDKQPWTLRGGIPWNSSPSFSASVFYPIYNSSITVYSSSDSPAIALYLGHYPVSSVGLTAPTNMTEARQFLFPPYSGVQFQVANSHATETATITVKIIRIWRAK